MIQFIIDRYEGEFESKRIQNWFNQQMPTQGISEIGQVKELRAFVDEAGAANKPAILLFTNKREVYQILKGGLDSNLYFHYNL